MKQIKIDKSKWPKPIPGFSCIEMKHQIQEKIYEETKHMTSEERREYFHNKSLQFQRNQSQKD